MRAGLAGLCLLAATLPARGGEPRQTVVDDAWQGEHGCHFSGRLTEVRPAPAKDSSALSALWRNIRMLFTHGEDGRVSWRVEDREWNASADGHGYWELTAAEDLRLPPGWHDITAVPGASSPAGVLVVDPRNTVAIISDIDDTILVTGVLDKRTLLQNSLTVTPEKRKAVPGMAELYRTLLAKNSAPGASAVFYLSSGPRQLTDSLRRFLVADGFPRGVLQLRKVAREGGESMADPLAYKSRHLEEIFAAFPQLSFCLFGDDGEHDPEIYARAQQNHPGQVAGIWIHHVNPDPKRPTFPGQHDVRELLPATLAP